jgi:hypothetical protein
MDPMQAIALAHHSDLFRDVDRPAPTPRRPRPARTRRRFAAGLRHLADRIDGPVP